MAAATAQRQANGDSSYTVAWLDTGVDKVGTYRRKGTTKQHLSSEEQKRLQGETVVVDWGKVGEGVKRVTRLRLLGDVMKAGEQRPHCSAAKHSFFVASPNVAPRRLTTTQPTRSARIRSGV